MAPSTAHDGPLGLRERKKARTRDALVDAALRRFTEHGFAATTTEEIAADVEVSQRTFFRYFASKEDAVLAVQEHIEEKFLAKLAARPLEEPPIEALSNALRDTWAELDERTTQTQLLVLRLLEDCPPLLAAHLRRLSEHQDRLVELIARRTGVDPATDLRPRLVAAAFGSVSHVAHVVCHQRGCRGAADLRSTIGECLDELVPALTEPWGTAGPAAPAAD
ncbi:TetR/AcrR family transcriptional regulator [Marinitenerispora sediminis]|uniref:TetR family transcriptional regulator n=1 Tax=Marinitenerispora sediminis TaxID=1931232 RepID=A0A368T8M9_9ACTN|nr:TetR family transcriptional regulator [Marinitenerispora sediminis]RCV53529.1 TetR family transcriptional regulator [Marinitenerispora sediminis]RCV57685.1 TetR family transcriptional regulator [Marinitenerispora sediminis]RCV60758.1 TetR family transcriptional regulator [Marinitenerispora sediminis]